MNSFSFPYQLDSKQVNQSLYRPCAPSSGMNIMKSMQHEKQMLLHLLKHVQLMLLHWSYKVTPMEQDKITQYGLEHWCKIGITNKTSRSSRHCPQSKCELASSFRSVIMAVIFLLHRNCLADHLTFQII